MMERDQFYFVNLGNMSLRGLHIYMYTWVLEGSDESDGHFCLYKTAGGYGWKAKKHAVLLLGDL